MGDSSEDVKLASIILSFQCNFRKPNYWNTVCLTRTSLHSEKQLSLNREALHKLSFRLRTVRVNKQAYNLHACENIHSINGKCMSSTEVGRGKLPTNTVIRLFPNSSNGFPHAFILLPCGRSMLLSFVISNIFCSSWDLNYATAACEHLAHWPRTWLTQNLKPARVKKNIQLGAATGAKLPPPAALFH